MGERPEVVPRGMTGRWQEVFPGGAGWINGRTVFRRSGDERPDGGIGSGRMARRDESGGVNCPVRKKPRPFVR